MRIAIDAISSKHGGAKTYLINLVRNLALIDTTNEYYLFVAPDKQQEYSVEQSNFHTVASEFPVRSVLHRLWWQQLTLRKILKELHIDLIYSPGNNCIIFPPCFSLLAVRYTTPFDNLLPRRYMLKRIKNLVRRKATEISARKADGVLFVSRGSRQHLLSRLRISAEKTRVIYHGRNNSFKPLDRQAARQRIHRDYGIDQKFILAVSSIYVHKNFLRLVQAFGLLRQRYRSDTKLVIIGGIIHRWYYRSVLQAIESLNLVNDVIFLGQIPNLELPVFYSAAEIFVFPSSSSETFGHPLIEAMACGVPVAASGTSVMPEICRHAAVYFDPRDVEEMAEKMAELVQNETLRETVIRRGLGRAQDFTWSKTARETLRFFHQFDHCCSS